MKITVLDKASLGTDTPFEFLGSLGDIEMFDATPPELLAERAGNSDVIIINKIKITREVLLAAKERLKLICVFATGYDNVDTVTAKELGIAVCNVPAYSTQSVALYTMSTTLALVTHLNEYRGYVNSGEYTKSGVPNKLTPVYHELDGMVWGIVGLGNIGKEVARLATAFGAKIIACKRTPVDFCECVSLDELCERSDIITLHCPLNDGTREIINAERIGRMKDGVIIVNEARGAVLNENDVANAVLSGKIGGFGCDVYSTEPFGSDHVYNKIKHLDNIILTPHAAWGSYESRTRCIKIIVNNIRSFMSGEKLNRVDI